MSELDSTSQPQSVPPVEKVVGDPKKRRAWVKYQIHLQGRSMAEVAAAAGVKRQSLYQTFDRPYPRMEKVLADAVGLAPKQLWPERYDADGLPLPRKYCGSGYFQGSNDTRKRTRGRNGHSHRADRQRGRG